MWMRECSFERVSFVAELKGMCTYFERGKAFEVSGIYLLP